jgi:saccharopine dehydrogenase-like NADP-dependent oxidoreductase
MSNSPCVLVLGAGTIGCALVDALRAPLSCVSLVNIADPFADNVFQVDVLDEPDLINNYHYIINTIPIHDPEKLAPLLVACLKNGIHYLDTNEDREVGRFVRLLGSSQKDVLFAPHCGLAPGLINVLGSYLVQNNLPEEIDLRVGSLTRLVDNDILYTPTWSPAGMINQTLNDFEVIENGMPKTYTSVFSREADETFGHFRIFYHDFHLDGIHYECFPTSGGIGTMAEMARSKTIKSLMYRTIRLHKHAEALRSLIHSYGFNRENLVKKLNKYRVYNTEDLVYIVARSHGPHPEQQRTLVAKAISGEYLGTPMTAIQKCTVAGVAAVLDLHIREIIPSGFLHQHDIDWSEYAESRYISAINLDWSR